MGEVYRARDARLGRDVAIKVIAAAFAGDPNRLRRLEQEARAAAALNHPNILAVFDIGLDGGAPYIVSELLEGETLREKLKTGSLPVRKAVEYGVQVAHGLAAAHEKGIVHRDLKPDNIFIATNGHVKILDFGLAKLTEPEPVAGVGSVVPTLAPGTQPGMVLGTLGYMSPEQVRGIPADHRSDIFSFGAILYEMLSGHAAFQRETPADTMSAILKEHPADIARPIPPVVSRIVERCLEKTPGLRFQSTEDLAFALGGALSPDSDIRTLDRSARPARTSTRNPWMWAAATAAAAAVVAIAIAAALLLREPADTALPVKMNVPQPATVVQTDPTIKISPDGTRLAFAAITPEGRRLWIRSLNALDAYPLMDTDGATQPFWSADGRSLGFFVSGQLKRIDIATGMVATICAAPTATGGTWNADDVIVFSSRGELHRISAAGGTDAVLNGMNGKRDGASLAYPIFLPDGHRLLYVDAGSGGLTEAVIYGAALDSADRTAVLQAAASNVAYGNGYLFFIRGTALVAQPFDAGRMALSGNPVTIAEEVQRTPNGVPGGAFSVSDRVLAYRIGAGVRGFPTQLSWFDRAGKVLGTVGERADYADVEISPDGTHAAVSELDPGTGRDVWIFDLARGIPTRFTSDPADEYASVWSPDGSKIIFTSRRDGHFDLFQKASSGAGAEEKVLVDNRDKWPMSWSPDGKTILYSTGTISAAGVRPHLWALPLGGDGKPFPVLNDAQFTQFPGRLSPDGRWIAYVSNESGQNEIYVAAFPGLNSKVRVSTSGGNLPRWRRDGREIFFLDGAKLMAADVNDHGDHGDHGGQSAQFSVGTVRMLFEERWPQGARYSYDVAPDGRILGATRVEPPVASPITLVVNWLADLKK